jgi:hypothetical protein
VNGSDRGLILGASPECSCSDGGKARETRIGAPAVIQTGKIPNTSRNHHRLSRVAWAMLRYKFSIFLGWLRKITNTSHNVSGIRIEVWNPIQSRISTTTIPRSMAQRWRSVANAWGVTWTRYTRLIPLFFVETETQYGYKLYTRLQKMSLNRTGYCV